MISKLFNPQSIVIVGGSNNRKKPGGAILANIIQANYLGRISVVNPTDKFVQGIEALTQIQSLNTPIDLAILSIPAKSCLEACTHLIEKCQTKAFIILSAGFSETSNEGKALESDIINLMNKHEATLIGPNCIGIKTEYISALFTKPIFESNTNGIDLISSSGATAIFFIEQGIKRGLKINNLISVGNGNQTGIEEILEYYDNHFDPQFSSQTKILYIEAIKNPLKFLTHTKSLIQKGCKIAAIKAGVSEMGGKAAQSHTGALLTNNIAIDALFSKAGVLRCNGRENLLNTANILLNRPLKGNRIAIVTHAGGPAVMLTDTLSESGFNIAPPDNSSANNLKEILFQGSSVANPFDFLATGTSLQLDQILTFCEAEENKYDGIVTIFGSPGLDSISEALNVIHQHQQKNQKPIYAILPSVLNSEMEIKEFCKIGLPFFVDEVLFGNALSSVYSKLNPKNKTASSKEQTTSDNNNSTYNACWQEVFNLFTKHNIHTADYWLLHSLEDYNIIAEKIEFPVVAKVNGINHKSDVGGVITHIKDHFELQKAFVKLKSIPKSDGVIIQQMLTGFELYIGAKFEPNYGHLITCGVGGIFIEIFNDIAIELNPISEKKALEMINSLKSAKIFDGYRGNYPINKDEFAQIVKSVSDILTLNPSILEFDINPLIATKNGIFAVDGRITKRID